MIEVRQTTTYAKWFAGLRDRMVKARIDIRIRRLSLGNPGDVKPVGEGVSELRISYGPGYRVYFTQKEETLIVLLAGGDKSSQERNIRLARELARHIQEFSCENDRNNTMGSRPAPADRGRHGRLPRSRP